MNTFIMESSVVRPATNPYGRLERNSVVGYEGEHNARSLVVETTDDLSAYASVSLIIDDLDCGAMTKTTSGSKTVLSLTLTSAMIGASGRKLCQLLMVDSNNTVIAKSSQFVILIKRSNDIERSVEDGVSFIIISEAVTEMAQEAASAAAEEAAADVVAECQTIANAAAGSASAAAQSAAAAQAAAESIVVDSTLDTASTNAIQNKAVAGAISELRADLGGVEEIVYSENVIDLPLSQTVDFYVYYKTSTGTYVWNNGGAGTTGKSYLIPVPTGSKYVTILAGTNDARLTFLQNADGITNIAQVHYCTSTDAINTVPAGQEHRYIIPEDCKYLSIVKYRTNTTTDYTPSKCDIVEKRNIPKKESVDALVNAHNFEILMCSQLAVRDDLPINLYLQNILVGINAKQIQRFTLRTHSNNVVLQDLNIAVFDTNDSGNNQNGYLRVMPTNLTAYAEKNFYCKYVRTAAGSGLSKNVMFIGDSLTWNGPMLSKIMERFETDVMNITSVGTVHTSGNHNGYYHEGRSGWSAYNYVHTPSKEASWGTVANAFYNPVSETFDYSYYVSTTGITADYIFICLGTNDLGRDDVGESIGAMIDSIHAYNQNIKIGVWMPPPQAHYPNNPFADFSNGQRIDKQIVEAFDFQTANNIYLVPALYVVDTEHDFPYTETQYDPYNASLTYRKNTDRLHPLDSGYYKLGDLLYTYIKYFGSLDAN